MDSGLFVLLALVCGYFLVSCGHLSDVITPCGSGLHEYLCDTLKLSSSQAYHMIYIRECNDLTSTRGKHKDVYNAPIKKGPPVDCNGATIHLGDAVNIHSHLKWYEAIYVGNDEVVMYDHQKQLATKRSMSSITDPIEKYKCQPGQLRVFRPKKRAKLALNYFKRKTKKLPRRCDFITWCYTGKTQLEAYKKKFRFKFY